MKALFRRLYRYVKRAEQKEADRRYEEVVHQRRSEGAKRGAATRKANKLLAAQNAGLNTTEKL